MFPLVQPGEKMTEEVPFSPDPVPQNFPFLAIQSYAEVLRKGDLDAVDAAEKALVSIDADNQHSTLLRAFVAVNREDVLSQARASAERFRAGKPLSILDGVPVAVKDEVDMKPYLACVGTRIIGIAPAIEDSTVVALLRAAGALLIGKVTTHEIGINPNGFNAHRGAVRNPCDVQRDPGGSSRGSAAAVAAGLVPLSRLLCAELLV